MLNARIRRSLALAGVFALCVAPGWSGVASAGAPDEATIASLQMAYEGEINAQARYLAFAEKADQEGYKQVASLFRAAARAEEVHAENHAMALRGMGGEPTGQVKAPAIKSTRENLQTAINGEVFERDVMYPDLIDRVRPCGNDRAIRTLKLALTAENEHAKLYKAALDDLEAWRGGKKSFYVCEVCGFTAATVDGKGCPSCLSSKDMFVAVK